MPGSLLSQYALRKAGSVPPSHATLYCIGVSLLRRSSLLIAAVSGDFWGLLAGTGSAAPANVTAKKGARSSGRRTGLVMCVGWVWWENRSNPASVHALHAVEVAPALLGAQTCSTASPE